jgi:hypothetical protein
MSVSIVCFSQTGNNEMLANHLAERLHCGVFNIVEKRRRTGLTTLLDLLFRRQPPIEKPQVAFDAYTHVLLIAPVWAGQIASPMRSFIGLQREQLREYSFLTLCGYDRPGQAAKLERELARCVGRPPRSVCELRVSDLFPPERRRNISDITPYRIGITDLDGYADTIESFLVSAGVEEFPPSPVADLRHRAALARTQRGLPSH